MKQTRQRGLTLIELMAALAVAILLMSVSVPMYQGIVANNRAVAVSNSFVSALRLARNEAVKRSENISVCAVVDASAVPPVCGSAGQWGNGWTVFRDDGSSADEHLRVWDMVSKAPTVTTAAATVVFESTGEATAAASFQLQQAHASSNQQRCVNVSGAGQVRAARC